MVLTVFHRLSTEDQTNEYEHILYASPFFYFVVRYLLRVGTLRLL
jgi:hypothetical protein